MATLKTNTISPSTGSALALTATSVTVNGTLAVTGTLNSTGVFTAPTGATIAATTGNLTVGTSAKFQVVSTDGSTTCGGGLNLTNTGATTHKLAASNFQILPSTGATTIASTLQTNGFNVNGLGWATGNGGAVTQITSKTTAVALNKLTGTITTLNGALAAGAVTTFTLTNTLLAATDLILITQIGGTVPANYTFSIGTITAATSAVISYRNTVAVGATDATVFKFIILKAPIS